MRKPRNKEQWNAYMRKYRARKRQKELFKKAIKEDFKVREDMKRAGRYVAVLFIVSLALFFGILIYVML